MKVARRSKKKVARRRRLDTGELLLYTGEVKYDVVLDCAREHGWVAVTRKQPEKDDCNIYWVDIAVVPDRLSKLKPWQCCNHFPGMGQIANKARMAKQLDKMARKFPKDYAFYPKTWILPSELDAFRGQFDEKGESKQWYIVKPDGGCQGKGIFLTQNFNKVVQADIGVSVAQTYLRRPLLIDGLKFDLRLYILVASVRPLVVYAFKDGLVRLCTEPYTKPTKQNPDDHCIHVANLGLNNHSESCQESGQADGGDEASKRSVTWFMQWMVHEFDQKKASQLWAKMLSVCLKTILSVSPTLQTEYDQMFGTATAIDDWQLPSRCFEILGVDLMIDSYLKPWLVEVNHLPSFGTDSPFDATLKQKLIHQAMGICKAMPSDRQDYNSEIARRKFNNPEARRTRAVESITHLLEQAAPHRLARLDALLLKHHGEEEKLLSMLQSKYKDQVVDEQDQTTDSENASVQLPCSPVSGPSTPPQGLQSPTVMEAAPEDIQDQSSDSTQEDLMPDYVQLYPLPSDDSIPTPLFSKASVYTKYETFALEHEARRRRRFLSPLQKYADTPELPPVPAPPAPAHTSNNSSAFGRANSSGPQSNKWRPPPMPSKNQSEAASRLARGRSSLPSQTCRRSSPEPVLKSRFQSHMEAAKLKSKYVLDKRALAPVATHSFELCQQLEQLGVWKPTAELKVARPSKPPSRPQTNDGNRRFSF